MVKTHNIKLTINNQSKIDMDYYGDWFDSGRLADTYEWPKVIKDGEEATILCYEKDWALAGCSGYVQYKMVDSVFTIAFSNPSVGRNKVNVGTDGKSVWDAMDSHEYKEFTVDLVVNDVTMICHCKCTGTSTNVAEATIKPFDGKRETEVKEKPVTESEGQENALEEDKEVERVDTKKIESETHEQTQTQSEEKKDETDKEEEKEEEK